jgi:hypothetical protein
LKIKASVSLLSKVILRFLIYTLHGWRLRRTENSKIRYRISVKKVEAKSE